MKHFPRVLAFAWERQGWLLLAIPVFVAVAFLAINPFGATPKLAEWAIVDALISVITLCVAVLVWVRGVRTDWENSLPKRLNVIYLHQQEPAMVCEEACLVTESDIRGMAQQMGAQINKKRNLTLMPTFELLRPHISSGADGTDLVKKYTLCMHLVDLPESVAEIRNSPDSRDVIVRKVVNQEIADEVVSDYLIANE